MTQWGLDNLFNPGKRHMDDEKRRLQSTREEVGDSSGGRRIDLESGRVAISLGGPRSAPAESVDEAAETDPVLEAADEPEIALAGDAEIEPDVAREDDAAAAADDTAPPSEPAAPPARRTRQVSATAWSRRG